MKKIYLSTLLKKGYVVVDSNNSLNILNEDRSNQIQAILNSFSSLGFALTINDVRKLLNIDEESLTSFYKDTFKVMKEARGNNVKHIVFYKNFPRINNISEVEFDIRAILHYLTASEEEYGFMSQDIEDFERQEYHNKNKEVVHIIDEQAGIKLIVECVNNLFEGKTAISSSLDFLLKNAFVDFKNLIAPIDIPFKENIAKYISYILNGKKKNIGNLLTSRALSFVNTPTDLLRVYAALSKGDVLLQSNVKFVSLNRQARRLFLSILNNMARHGNLFDDLARHEFMFKKMFEKLHVGEYSQRFPEIFEVVSNFRNDEYYTYYSKLENAKTKQSEYLNILMQRPGEFARRLDSVLRTPKFDINQTLRSFKAVSNKISSTLLLQLWSFFKNRDLYDTRIIAIKKANCTIFKEIEDTRAKVDENTLNEVISIIESSLMMIYSTYPKLENVYVDEAMKNYALPTNNRNSSLQHKTLTYGTRVKLDTNNGSFLRVFTHWKNMKKSNNQYNGSRVDVDLSLELVDESFQNMTSVAWHNMNGGKGIETYHSGDIVTAPKGASEFIDLNYKKANEKYRYAIVTNCVYTGQSYSEIPECFSGVMFMESKHKNGEIFNPEFVKMKFDLTQSSSNSNIAFAIDLKTEELIWLDCPLSTSTYNVVACSDYSLIMALKSALKTHMNIYDFIALHRGHISFVEDKKDAEFIISDSDDATLKPFDVETITAKWL